MFNISQNLKGLQLEEFNQFKSLQITFKFVWVVILTWLQEMLDFCNEK